LWNTNERKGTRNGHRATRDKTKIKEERRKTGRKEERRKNTQRRKKDEMGRKDTRITN
jgi:hypothetical protein